ncbi:hypothetical protein ACFQFC_05590 [Amorphoplanes digitatis]|uniref:Secreted protein n=1 Tax=Actinoplanes digitatis TaxID=1868 RepID=A0A7W7HZK9_9ACTN|nr:hypothetical protein [Actinoplanes digitatis]MBB4763664.1 hypothetical protein [Actinoplanes digitatis]GID93078.1 hypothetical protein Adi01nite_24900 [Actinoplanes digitatis]
MIVTAVALLATTSAMMARIQGQVRVIGGEAAPQAATAADLYFALSDMDAQVARMVLAGDAAELSGSQIDALGTYRGRSRQVDADLQRSLTTATGAAERAVVLELLHHLAVYRQRVWQALTAQSQAPPQPPGRLPPAALGYYTQATNVLHLDLLPAAERLRDAGEDRLDRAYARKRTTEIVGLALTAVLGAGLVVLLLILQVWLARRFRRVFNPALLAATVLAVVLTAAAGVVLVSQGRLLSAARDESLRPYLALSQARALSYDAAADTSRYLVSANLAYYREDFTRKSQWLVEGGGLAAAAGGPDVSAEQSGQVVERWLAYRRGHDRIVTLAGSGRTAAAIDALTGIRRGDAAFDFSYFDAAVDEIATARRREFDAALRDAGRLLAGWTVIPVFLAGLVVLLVPLGVRKRLAEYR